MCRDSEIAQSKNIDVKLSKQRSSQYHVPRIDKEFQTQKPQVMFLNLLEDRNVMALTSNPRLKDFQTQLKSQLPAPSKQKSSGDEQCLYELYANQDHGLVVLRNPATHATFSSMSDRSAYGSSFLIGRAEKFWVSRRV